MTRTTMALMSATLLGGLILGGCQQQTTRSAEPKAATTAAMPAASGNAAYDQALSAAKASLKEAASYGGEWRDAGKMLKQAEKAAAAGDYAKAIKLANTVKFQGEAGKQQAMEQANVGNPGYLY